MFSLATKPEVPIEIDDRVGVLKLQSIGVKIDKFTDDQ